MTGALVRNHSSGPSVEDWGTPQELVDKLNILYNFDLDPCATDRKIAKAPKFFTPEDDGLKQKWFGNVFLNPPWSRGTPIKDWIIKAGQELDAGHCDRVVALLPASVGTNWFNDYVMPYATHIYFVRGRVAFIDYTQASKHLGKKKANFDSVIIELKAKTTLVNGGRYGFSNITVSTWRQDE